MAAVAAHELLAPLIMTEAYATLVSDRLDDSRHAMSRRDLAVLSRHVARARVLVETLLDDLRSNGRPPQPRRLDLSSLARECLRSLAPEVRASGAQVQLGPLPRVIGDRRLISVVLTTLITTALRSGRPEGMLAVDGVRNDSHWSICVAYGPTIPTVAPPRHSRGAAVGLSICRHLVVRRGGKIDLGTQDRFLLTLPLEEPARNQRPTGVECRHSVTAAGRSEGDGQRHARRRSEPRLRLACRLESDRFIERDAPADWRPRRCASRRARSRSASRLPRVGALRRRASDPARRTGRRARRHPRSARAGRRSRRPRRSAQRRGQDPP